MRLELCCLCDGALYRLYLKSAYLLEDKTFDLVRCSRCGLVRVEPMPDPETLKAMYTEKYFDRDFSCGVRKGTYLESEAMRVEEYREILNGIKLYKPEGRLLEIGCAAGSFLNYSKRAGYEVEGVDVSKWAADMAREQFDVKVRVGRLVEIGYDDDAFDVIFMGDLLEHEPHPLELLEETKRILKPTGVATIKVPTYLNSFYYRLARLLPVSWFFAHMDLRLLHAMKLSHQTPSYPPYHVYEFSRDLLGRLCEKAGLQVIGHHTSLLVPEFLHGWKASLVDRIVYTGFMGLRKLVFNFNLPAGHVMVFAAKGD